MRGPAPSPQDLVGHELTTSFLAASMRMFGFGEPRPDGRGVVADYSLHMQCPWRFDSAKATLVSSADLNRYGGEGDEPADWSYEHGNSLQERRLDAVLGGRIPLGQQYCYRSGLVVSAVDFTATGDLTLSFADRAALRVFALGSDEEQWRLFRPRGEAAHFVFGEDD